MKVKAATALPQAEVIPGRNEMRILFLARSLDRGGAERQLAALASGLARRGHTVAVAVFYPGGSLEVDVRDAGVAVVNLAKEGRWDLAGFLQRLVSAVRHFHPDILHGYLAVPNTLALLARALPEGPRVIWGVRASVMDLDRYDWLSGLAYGLERQAARWPDLIVCNSRAGMEHALRRKFPARRLRLVVNGIDTDRFAPQPELGRVLRGQLGIGEDDCLIGLVARLDPMKDHPTFLQAAALVSRWHPKVRFLCVGDGTDAERRRLAGYAADLGIADRVIWQRGRNDMPAVYGALSIACLTSTGEGFPNVVAEAMACGIPCAVTGVGDAADIVGDLGEVVPPRDPAAVADALGRLIVRCSRAGDSLRQAVRLRIANRFSLTAMLDRSEHLFQTVRSGVATPP